MEKNEACESWERKELKIPGIDWSQIMQAIEEQIWTKQTHMSEKSKQKEKKKKKGRVERIGKPCSRSWKRRWENLNAIMRKSHCKEKNQCLVLLQLLVEKENREV